MTIQEIQKLVARQNEHLQSEMESEARQLIDRITQLHQAKVDCDRQIDEARKRLRELSVKPMSVVDVIGETSNR